MPREFSVRMTSVIDFETAAAKHDIKLPLPHYIEKENICCRNIAVFSHQTLASLQLSFSVVICIYHQCINFCFSFVTI